MSQNTFYRTAAAHLYQKLRENQSIPDAWENWEGYRKELTDYLIRSTRAGSSVAVFGAGESNDMDLMRLCRHFSKVVLHDFDLDAMQRGVFRQGMDTEEKLCLVQSDFVGISQTAYIRYAEELLKEREEMPGKEAVGMRQLEELYAGTAECSLDFGTECYDYAVIAGVDSQLNNMAEWLRYMIYRTEESALTGRIQQENMRLVRRFHDAVLAAVKEQCFIGCERECLGRPGAIEGAVQSLWDIEERLNRQEVQIIQGLSLYWPFDIGQEKIFQMEIWNLKKNR